MERGKRSTRAEWENLNGYNHDQRFLIISHCSLNCSFWFFIAQKDRKLCDCTPSFSSFLVKQAHFFQRFPAFAFKLPVGSMPSHSELAFVDVGGP